MSMRLSLRRLTRNRVRAGAFVTLAIVLICSASSILGVLRIAGRPQTHAAIRTDKANYLSGEPVTISGEGFSPFENVSLLVTHRGGTAESGAGHERFFVTTDSGERSMSIGPSAATNGLDRISSSRRPERRDR